MTCIDASLAGKWLFPEEYSANALALARMARASGESLIGPPHLRAEVSNIIRRRMRREALSLDRARGRFRRFQTFPVVTREVQGLYDAAILFSHQYHLPAAYDAVYVALAALLGDELWTDDRRLLRGLRGKLSFVRWIGDYPS